MPGHFQAAEEKDKPGQCRAGKGQEAASEIAKRVIVGGQRVQTQIEELGEKQPRLY